MRCMDRVVLEELLGHGLSLTEIGRRKGLQESTVGYWVEKHGLQPVNRQKRLARGGLQRDDLERLIAADASITDIARAVGRSKAMVRYWLKVYGLQTIWAKRRSGSAAGQQRMMLSCSSHGLTEFQLRPGGGYKCLSAALRRLYDGDGESSKSLSRRLAAPVCAAVTVVVWLPSSSITSNPLTSASS